MKACTDFDGSELFTVDAPILPRSRLFCLPPVRGRSIQQESLISLLVRTSRAHAVNPRRLIGRVFGEVEPAINELVYAGFFSNLAGTINGLGKYAKLFVSAMEKLTGQENLRRLTLLPWQEFFPHNGQGLLARHPRWCPACLFQQRLQGQETAFPLAWSLEVVHICPIHRRRLEDQCPHCGKRQPFIPRYPDSAVCDFCRQPLVSRSDSEPPNDMEIWVAEAVRQMIVCHAEEGFYPSVGQFQSFLLAQVVIATGGNRSAFCRAVGLQPRALNNWINKGERPSITQFLTLCYGMKVMPANIFLDEEATGVDLRLVAGPLKQRSPCPRLKPARRDELESLLHLRLEAPQCPPVSEIAKVLGLAARSLRYWFPDLCRQITAKYREAEAIRIAAHRADQCIRVGEIVRQVKAVGNYPSRRRVNVFLRREHMSLAQPHLLNAYLAAITKVLG